MLALLGGAAWALPGARAEGLLYASPQQRFGVGVTGAWGYDIEHYTLSWVNPAWYSDWSWQAHPPRPAGIEYVQLVSVGAAAWPPRWADLRRAINANPGSLWLLGNEPDTRSQDECTPAEYAARHHELYRFIKRVDPTAQVANGSIVQPTPLRLRWLDEVLEAYETLYGGMMPVDVWNIHVQILREERDNWGCGIPPGLDDVDQGTLYALSDNGDPAILQEHVWRFRQWMSDHGQQDKPLIISEFGVVMPSDYLPKGDDTRLDFMRESFDFLLSAADRELGCAVDGYRLVQRWAWYSLNEKGYDPSTGEGYNGSLYAWDRDELTDLGRLYAEYTAADATIRGSIDLQGRPDPPDASWRTRLELKLSQGGVVRYDLHLLSDEQGRFVVTDLLPGVYDVWIRGSHTLSNQRHGVTLGRGDNALDMGRLREGDANGDDLVDVEDYSILRSVYLLDDPSADFNGDGWVDIADVALLRNSFGQMGPLMLHGGVAR